MQSGNHLLIKEALQESQTVIFKAVKSLPGYKELEEEMEKTNKAIGDFKYEKLINKYNQIDKEALDQLVKEKLADYKEKEENMPSSANLRQTCLTFAIAVNAVIAVNGAVAINGAIAVNGAIAINLAFAVNVAAAENVATMQNFYFGGEGSANPGSGSTLQQELTINEIAENLQR